jgi:Flp pilus assembly CpaE family ATPase
MSESRLKLLLIEDDPADAELVRNMLTQAEGFAFDLQWVRALLPGLDRLAKGDIDAVLLDATLPDSHGLDAVPALRMHAPSVPVVILSALDSESLALRAVQIGAQDYLVKGKLQPDLLSRQLRYAIVRQKSQSESAGAASQPAPPVRVIGCIGAKGGVGTSTIACNSSLELKRQAGQRVLLADVDLSGGSVGFLTQAKSTYTILDAANDLLRLDASFWEKVVSNGPENLEVLPLAAPAYSEEQIHSDRIRYVLRFLRSQYPWIVLDLGRLNQFSTSLLSDLTDLLLVTTFDLATVSETQRVVQRLAEIGFESRRVTLIVNKVPKIDRVAAREVSKVLGIPNSVIVPASSSEGLDGKVGVRQHLVSLAANFVGIEEKLPAWKRLSFLAGLTGRNRELKTA